MNYKRRNQILVGLSILLLVFSWLFAFSKTWDMYKEYHQLNNQFEKAKNNPKSTIQLKEEIAQLSQQAIQSNNKNNQGLQLEVISSFASAHDLKIIEIPRAIEYSQKGYHIETNSYQVQGDFKNITSLVQFLEVEKKVAKVASVEYKLVTDLKNNSSYLVATIFLQNIKNNQND